MNMKTCQSRRQTAKVSHSRWFAYATASAATALAGSHSAEAAIHYSGRLHQHFPPDREKTKTFPLDQAGDSLFFKRGYGTTHRDFVGTGAFFTCFGIVSGAFRGFRGPNYFDYLYGYVSKLPFGENIEAGHFQRVTLGDYIGVLAGNRFSYAQWQDRGTGFIGFRFNSGAGIQYGWARVRRGGDPERAFIVVDYAYADPGEQINAGQIGPPSSDE